MALQLLTGIHLIGSAAVNKDRAISTQNGPPGSTAAGWSALGQGNTIQHCHFTLSTAVLQKFFTSF